MSTEEIIHSWKNGQAHPAPHNNEEPETQTGKAPTNPAGEQELTEEELDLIEGGVQPQSCHWNSCSQLN